MIKDADPIQRLNALSIYMNRWINEWPKPTYRFNEFFKNKFPHLIPGTVEHAREIATHCFYCNTKLIHRNSAGNHGQRSSIDHYLPRSKGKTEKYVICCAHCNTSKGNVAPEKLISRITQAHLKGNAMWGFHGARLKFIAEQIQKITNDRLYNMGPRIYYFKR